MLEYKLSWAFCHLILVPAHHTSQQCASCGHLDPKSRKSQSVFCCSKCGVEIHADLNAAKNILARGHRVLACENSIFSRLLKQESAGTGDPLLPSEV
jgi:putative transposase